MASARKKLEEKNIKILRELVSLPENKHCFDCHQRGPTYVNVTVGSFVCTTCSGMLRGLTPPHRVKSISMATFTQEEIDLLKSKGNEYCRKVWLGLYDGEHISKDEQQIKELMVAKYEKKRYYVKPSAERMSNGTSSFSNSKNIPKIPMSSSINFPNQNPNNNINRNHNNNLFTPQPLSKPKEVHKVVMQDPFSSINLNSSNSNIPIDNFANFDNNPVFSATQNAQFSNSVPLIPPVDNKGQPPPPSEDRYAALKDLDSLMKSQQAPPPPPSPPDNKIPSNAEWDPGNIWSSSSSQASSTMFDTTPPNLGPAYKETFNPFSAGPTNNDLAWNNAFGGNPFNAADFGQWPSTNGQTSANGLTVSQSLNFSSSSSKPYWNNFANTPNPFSVSSNGQSVSHHHSSNPFL